MLISRAKLVVVVASTAATIIAVLIAVLWHPQRPEPQQVEPGLASELAVRVTPMIEAELTTEWFAGGNGQRMVCAVRTIGTAPDSAKTSTEVKVVYVWSLCASVGTEVQSESSKPVAVRLIPSVSIEAPGDGADYTTQVKRIFPERLHETVLENTQVHDLEALLDKRIAEGP